MAKNITRYLQTMVGVPAACSDPATPNSGDPVRHGERTGIALTKEGEGGNAATEATIWTGDFIATFSVKGVDGGGNSAVADGDSIYYVDADTPKLSKKATGFFFGIARGAVTSGATATIEVEHIASANA